MLRETLNIDTACYMFRYSIDVSHVIFVIMFHIFFKSKSSVFHFLALFINIFNPSD